MKITPVAFAGSRKIPQGVYQIVVAPPLDKADFFNLEGRLEEKNEVKGASTISGHYLTSHYMGRVERHADRRTQRLIDCEQRVDAFIERLSNEGMQGLKIQWPEAHDQLEKQEEVLALRTEMKRTLKRRFIEEPQHPEIRPFMNVMRQGGQKFQPVLDALKVLQKEHRRVMKRPRVKEAQKALAAATDPVKKSLIQFSLVGEMLERPLPDALERLLPKLRQKGKVGTLTLKVRPDGKYQFVSATLDQPGEAK